jgi:hypothetical protein
VPFCSRAPEDGVLKPIVARYQGKVSRIYFRADAVFAMPEVYEFLEAERIKYAIRLPATLSPRRLHRDEHEPPGRARRCFLQQARDVRAMDQGGQRRDRVDATVVPTANAVRLLIHGTVGSTIISWMIVGVTVALCLWGTRSDWTLRLSTKMTGIKK